MYKKVLFCIFYEAKYLVIWFFLQIIIKIKRLSTMPQNNHLPAAYSNLVARALSSFCSMKQKWVHE